MKRFAQLYRVLDQSTNVKSKIKILVDYFEEVENKDKIWAIALLSQKRPKRIITTSDLRKCYEEEAILPFWLFEKCYELVGDLSETIALLAPDAKSISDLSLSEWINEIIELKDKDEEIKKAAIKNAWKALDQEERYVYNKLVTGGFRIKVASKIIISAISRFTNIDEIKITHRLNRAWDPSSISFEELVINADASEDLSKPYPFHSIKLLEQDIDKLGDHLDWMAERKWDGLRGQLILRQNQFFLWNDDEELISEKFPELEILQNRIDKDVVMDCEILPYKDDKILNFNLLQARIGRKNITKKQLIETPIIFIASDLLEYNGEDIRERPMIERRKLLESVIDQISSDRLLFSDEVKFESWDKLDVERQNSRAYFSEGILLKQKDSKYSDTEIIPWWNWKVDPFTIDAVLIYVQRGTGQKAKTYSEFTFAVKHGEDLIPFTKTSTGLSIEEVEEISKFVKKNTRERFGPVRSIEPELVFEIEFDGIAESTRHKSGIALRFPRIKKWKIDAPKEKINTLPDLMEMLNTNESDHH